MFDEIRQILGYARLSQLPRYVGRALSRPTAQTGDFIFPQSADERAHLASLVRSIRGEGARPAVFVHGVLPRSGTNYLADVLALHPDLQQDPGRLWEFPLLYVAPGADALQREFRKSVV